MRPPDAGRCVPVAVLAYLSDAHRIVIANSRLIALDQRDGPSRWKGNRA